MSDAGTERSALRVSDFDFELPPELIAQEPPAVRGSSRMLVMERATGELRDANFADLPSLLALGDLLVLNDSRVIPARLYAHKTTSGAPGPSHLGTGDIDRIVGAPSMRPSSGAWVGEHEPPVRIEVLLTEPAGENRWRALVKPGRKVGVGQRLEFLSQLGDVALEAEVVDRGEFGERVLAFAPVDDFFAVLERIGHVPLPPYIRREDAAADRDRYQTVFAYEPGSVAAPTAGLHFTPGMLERLTARGVGIARVTLHVGLGTFAPLRVERVDEVHLHSERYTISACAADAVNRALSEGRRVVAVGTTVVRTLEAAARSAVGGRIEAHSGNTDIFISPGFEFRVVGALLTNFHLPQSSLLMLVSAFAGRERALAAYRHAVARRYRFFSYGDCMLIQ
jgi:S-adenosylmethionine:tRNA ribosyltransferase-isomerase